MYIFCNDPPQKTDRQQWKLHLLSNTMWVKPAKTDKRGLILRLVFMQIFLQLVLTLKNKCSLLSVLHFIDKPVSEWTWKHNSTHFKVYEVGRSQQVKPP